MNYAVVTPVRDEEANLPRLASALGAQVQLPTAWFIVDNGSEDDTRAIVAALVDEHAWIHSLDVKGATSTARGAPIVRSFHAALAALADSPPDVVVSIDADVSFERDFFERLLRAFALEPELGIASGSGWELRRGRWRQRHLTGSTVWGATRAYRWECLQIVLPLEERVGWDGIDELKANAAGWRTRILLELPFLHHRREGERDGAWRMRVEQGRTAHYMGYRPWYLVLRAFYNMRADAAALGLVWGYVSAAMSGAPQLASDPARAYLREQQHPAKLRARAREALGRRR